MCVAFFSCLKLTASRPAASLFGFSFGETGYILVPNVRVDRAFGPGITLLQQDRGGQLKISVQHHKSRPIGGAASDCIPPRAIHPRACIVRLSPLLNRVDYCCVNCLCLVLASGRSEDFISLWCEQHASAASRNIDYKMTSCITAVVLWAYQKGNPCRLHPLNVALMKTFNTYIHAVRGSAAAVVAGSFSCSRQQVDFLS